MAHLHEVIVENSQHAKLGVARVVIFRKAEVEAAFQPPRGTRHVQAVGGNLLHWELRPGGRVIISNVARGKCVRVRTYWDVVIDGLSSSEELWMISGSNRRRLFVNASTMQQNRCTVDDSMQIRKTERQFFFFFFLRIRHLPYITLISFAAAEAPAA